MNLMDYVMENNTIETQQIRNEKNQKLDAALDSIRKKYGRDSIVRGSMMQQKQNLKAESAYAHNS